MTNSGISFTSATVTLNWVASDVDAGSTTANFRVGKYENPTWTFPTVASPSATSIQATGITSFSDFAVGELCPSSTAFSYTGSPYCSNAGTATPTITGTAGTFTSAAGLSINSATGAVNLAASTPGTYTVTNSAGGCSSLSTASITITAAPLVTISYAGSPYCSNAGTASVTFTGTTGGSYSSTTGLSINTTTGAVNLSASTPGAYTVTYTVAASGGCTAYTTTAPITISAAPAVTISYAGSPYCSNAGTASVTFTGTTGGTYSSTTGLSINITTGAVNLSASTPGTYTVTYTVAASGGCTTYTTTAPITITAAPSATIFYAGSPYCSNAGTATVTRTGTAAGTYTSTAGLTINSTTGSIILSSSTPGTYTVTYTVAAAGGCAQFTTTTAVTVTTAPSATISYAGSPYYVNGGTASVTFSGTAGGTYSSPAGLSVNATTGAVTLSTSTPGTYTVTYTVGAAGGCPVYTTTTSITVLGRTTITWDGGAGTNNWGDAMNWSLDLVPASSDDVDLTGANTININVAATTKNLLLNNAGLALTINAGNSLAVSGNLALTAGTFNTEAAFPTVAGTVNVAGGTVGFTGSGSQTVPAYNYNNLTLSSPSGASVKTMPASALTIAGNLTSTAGAGASVSYTAAANITVNGSVNIGAATTFNGGSFSHAVHGNWINNGAFTGSTSTVNFTGSGAALSGAGVNNFYNLQFSQSGITASAGTAITVSGNISTAGPGTFTHAPGGTLIMNGSLKTITGTGFSFDNLTISGTVSTANNLSITGNLSVSESFTATVGDINMLGTAKTISGAGSITFNALTVSGSVTSTSNFSLVTLDVSGTFSASAGTATFIGAGVLDGTANLYNVTLNGTSLQLSTNAVLGIANIYTITAGTLNVTSTAPNTVNFNGAGAQTVPAGTYHRLTFSNGNTKTATGAITANGIFTIGTGTTFNAGAYTDVMKSDWVNNGSFTAGTGTIEFAGNRNTILSGNTTFNNVTINKSSSANIVTLASNVSVATISMTNGGLRTGVNSLTITNTRTGNGIILGNIQRTHAFTAGVAYAFEGPDNTITFASVSGVTSVTVKVTVGVVNDFPYEGAINRAYDIVVPSGTYNAALRLHYEPAELNGNLSSTMKMWRYNVSSWVNIGKSGYSETAFYVEQTSLTNINRRFTLSDDANIVVWNGSASSDWSNPANWTSVQGSPSLPPGDNDIVALGTAAFTNQPAISTAAYHESLIFGSVQPVTLTLLAGGSLTGGNITGAWSANAIHTINVNNQPLVINGELILSDGVNGQAINMNIGFGTVTVAEDVVQSGGANITFTGSGTLSIGNDLNYSSGTFTAGSGTVIYNGAGPQIIAGVSYNNLTINKTAGNALIDNITTVAGNLLLSSGELEIRSTVNLSGNMTINPGAVLDADMSLINNGGNWTNNGTVVPGSGTVNFNGTGAQSIYAFNFDNLIINKPSGTATLTRNVNINGDISVLSGVFDISTYTIARATHGGIFTISDGATLLVGGANSFPLNYEQYILGINSTVEYNGTVAQTAGGVTYGNLVFTNGGTNAKTLSANAAINGNVTINSGSAFDGATYSISLYGNWVNNGTFLPSSSEVSANGTGKTLMGNTVFNGLTVNGSYTVVSSNNTFGVGNLSVQSGGTLDISSSKWQVSGTISSSGIFTAHEGTIEMNGTFAQTIPANTFADNAVKDLMITNAAGVSLAGTLNITNTISFGNINNSTFTSGGYLTLVSNDAGTARVADITNGGANTGNNISGTVTVQRFNIAKRATRFLTSPVNSPGSIRANWMENTNNPSTSVNNNPVPGFGTHITGSGGSTNGFDPTYTNNPSLYTYNNVTQAWAPATSTATPLMAGHGYRIVVRGSRSTNLNSNEAPPSPTTLRATGTLVTGTVSMRKPGGGGTPNMPELSAATNGYSFIGNPYASPVDWLTLERTDLTSSIYIFDATIQGANGRGAYVSYNASTLSNSNASSQVDNYIQSGQAFFVQSAGPNPSLTFKEQNKTGINRRVFRPVKDMPHLSLQLLLPRQENTGASADGLAAYFSNDFDTAVGNEDSYKLANQDENIAIVRNGKTLSLEGRKPVISTDTLPLKIWNITLKNYIIKIDLSGFDTNLESFLEDSYLHTSTTLDNNAQTFVRFSITGDSASFAANRFRIVFRSSVVLAAQPGIKAYEKNKGVEVEWTTSENNIDRFEVEKSADAAHFELMESVNAKVNADAYTSYSWFDENPIIGDNFYRIKSIDNFDKINYSKVSKVSIKSIEKSMTIFPNPVIGNTINLFLKNIDKGNYRVSLINSSGQIVYAGNISHTGGSGKHVIKVNNILPKGSYQLQMFGNAKVETISILAQ